MRIEALQAGRAIAALAVVAFHAHLYLPTADFLLFGKHGVDFFFVLSGFIISHVAGRTFAPAKFLRDRAIRIFVPYLPVGIAAAIGYSVTGIASEWNWNWFSSLTLLPSDGRPALTVAWTLQRELIFYAFAAVFFWSGRPMLLASLWAAAILARMTAVAPLGYVEEMFLGPINIEFVAGIALYRLISTEWLASIPVPNLLGRLGDASYALYLVHLPVMGILWRIDAGFVALVIASVAAALAYHWAFERPALAWLKGRHRTETRQLLDPHLRA